LHGQGHTVIGFRCKYQRPNGTIISAVRFGNSRFQPSLPPESFDGIFANASLIHTPKEMVRGTPAILYDRSFCGAIVMSICRGDGEGCIVQLDIAML